MESAAAFALLDDEQPAALSPSSVHSAALGTAAEDDLLSSPSSAPSSHKSAAASYAASSVPAPPAIESSSASAWLYQLWCLWRKCVLQLSRQPVMATAAFLSPLAGVAVLFIVSRAVYSASQPSPFSHESFSTVVRPCMTQDAYYQQSSASVHCTSISYAPSNAATDSIIRRLLAGTALAQSDVVSFASGYELQLSWAGHVGSQDVGIVFLNSSGTGTDTALGEWQYRYQLWYNSSQSNAYWRVLSLQFALEQAIANTVVASVVAAFPPASNSSLASRRAATPPSAAVEPPSSPLTPTSLSYSFLPYLLTPSTSTDQYNDRPSQYAGAALLSVGAAIFALLVVQHVTAEKQAKLLAMLRMNGMFDSAYWLSTLLLWAAIALFASLLATCVGVVCGLQVYANVSFLVHWLSLWLYMAAMIASALFVASLFTRAAWVNLLSFLFIALVIGYSIGMAVGSVDFPPQLLEVSNAAPAAVFLNALLPVFHYSKLWYVFSQSSKWQTVSNQTYLDSVLVNGAPVNRGYWPSVAAGVVVQQHMGLDDLSRPVMQAGRYCNYLDEACCSYMSNYFSESGYQPLMCSHAPPPGFNLVYLVLLTALYTSLAWYASQVGDERAGGKKPWFLCTPSYWSSAYARKRPADDVVDGDTQAAERERSRLEQSIRTVKLTKDFKDVTAVKELSLHMAKNECFCLLGHNGAGKTTTINVLTGVYAPTFGEAYVCGLSVREDSGAIHQLLGVCSQENVLWDNLTVLEHLHVLAAIRRLQPAAVAAVAEDRLRLVNLWDHRTKRANQLSGGMKRRLRYPACICDEINGVRAMAADLVWPGETVSGSSSSSSNSKTFSKGATAGIAVGVAVAAIVLTSMVWCLFCGAAAGSLSRSGGKSVSKSRRFENENEQTDTSTNQSVEMHTSAEEGTASSD